MHDIEQLPLQQWAEQLKKARVDASLDISAVAQTLMLSNAQLRGLENGTLSAFHGPGYYLRAVEKYARHLDITLDPPVTELTLTDSQIALNRVKNQPSAANLAKRESRTLGADAMPRSRGSSRIGIWLGGLLAVLIAAGTWMAINEGWPEQDTSQASVDPSGDRVTLDSLPAIRPESPVSESPSAALRSSQSDQPSPLLAMTNPASQGLEPSTQTPLATETITPASALASTEAPTQPEPTAEPTPATESAASASPPALDTIEAQFNADCWVEVRFADGRIEQGIYKPGQTLEVPVTDIAGLTFGNAQAVNATRAGNAFDVLVFTRSGNNVARISANDLKIR